MTDLIASNNFLNFFNADSASPILGAIIYTFTGGACIGGLTSDRFSRRRTIQIDAFVCFDGVILQATTLHLVMMLSGWSVTGWAVGIDFFSFLRRRRLSVLSTSICSLVSVPWQRPLKKSPSRKYKRPWMGKKYN
jgi:hypothetical protein